MVFKRRFIFIILVFFIWLSFTQTTPAQVNMDKPYNSFKIENVTATDLTFPATLNISESMNTIFSFTATKGAYIVFTANSWSEAVSFVIFPTAENAQNLENSLASSNHRASYTTKNFFEPLPPNGIDGGISSTYYGRILPNSLYVHKLEGSEYVTLEYLSHQLIAESSSLNKKYESYSPFVSRFVITNPVRAYFMLDDSIQVTLKLDDSNAMGSIYCCLWIDNEVKKYFRVVRDSGSNSLTFSFVDNSLLVELWVYPDSPYKDQWYQYTLSYSCEIQGTTTSVESQDIDSITTIYVTIVTTVYNTSGFTLLTLGTIIPIFFLKKRR